MKAPKLSAACMLGGVVLGTKLYGGAEAAEIPGTGIEFPAEIMQYLIPLLFLFVPTIFDTFFPQFPQLKEIVLKILRLFNPDVQPLNARPITSTLAKVAEIADELAAEGDTKGVACCNHLHSHLLERKTEANTKTKAKPDEAPQA